MPIKVFNDRENTEKLLETKSNVSVKDLLGKLNINPVTVIVSRDGDIMTEEDIVGKDDEIKLISVISGG
jgi:sulfur carrier protein ThiS